MPALYEIRWLAEGRTELIAGSRGNYYVLSESDLIDLNSVPAWCHRCGQISLCEEVPTVDQIDRQIRDLSDPASELYRITRQGLDGLPFRSDALLRERIASLQRRRRWRQERKSPPKCIYCGTTEILKLPMGTPIPHPSGLGEIQVECIGMCSTDFNEWYFTPEGDRIPHETPESPTPA